MLKAAREAKTRTSWSDPDPEYERAVSDFVAAVLQPADDAPFLTDVARFVSLIARAGAWNALSRLTVHLTAPGTPDIYQGDEFWNALLVDPDNRRPVDFQARSKTANELGAIEQVLTSSAPIDLYDQRVKLFVTARLLRMRRTHADLFTHGDYFPLPVSGQRARHVIAFAREFRGQCAVTVVPRLTGALGSGSTPTPDWWVDTAVALPERLRNKRWESQVISEEVPAADSIALERLFGKLPMLVAVG